VVVPGDWELVGGDPAPGEPAAYAELAQQLGRTAEAAGEAHEQLKKIQDQVDNAIWRGKTADTFRERIEELPEKLEKLHASYDKASSALREYGTKLREFQTRAAAIVGDAGRAHQDEAAEQTRLDQARALDPATPTTVQEDAVEAARQRLRSARDQIDQIREERQGAESHALAGLDDAGDLGIHNKSWLVKTLRAIADAAEFVSIVLAVLAIAVVVVVLLTNPVGWATLGAALAAAGPLFSAATEFAVAGFIFKVAAKGIGDDDLTWGELGKDGAILFGTWGFGQALEVVKLTQIRTMTMEFQQMTTEVRPIMRLVTASDDLLLTQVRTTVQITRVDIVRTVTKPLHLDTIWEVGLARYYHIPKYLDEHPEVARALGQHPPAGVVMAGAGRPGGPHAVMLAHTPIPERAGAR
jgi:uncharacterized protein YukE